MEKNFIRRGLRSNKHGIDKFIDQTFHIAEHVRTRARLEMYWRPLGRRAPGVMNHCLRLQWFPNYAPGHTAAPPDVIRCAAKNIEIKINHVQFLKFHPADFCQYSTLSILVIVIGYAAQCYDNRAIAYVAT